MVQEVPGRKRKKKVLLEQGKKRRVRCCSSRKVENREKEPKGSRKGFDLVESSLVVGVLAAWLVV